MPLTGQQTAKLADVIDQELNPAALDLIATDLGVNLKNLLPGASVKEWAVKLIEEMNGRLPACLLGAAPVHVLKLAVIYEAARSCTLKVTKDSWDLAVKTARDLEGMIFDLLRTGMTREGSRLTDIEDMIHAKGAERLKKSEYTYQLKNAKDKEEVLQMLIAAERVKIIPRDSTGGRAPQVIVHRDFW